MTSTVINQHDDLNGSLADDWESYKGYTRFYYIADEVFLYANPILIIIGRIRLSLELNRSRLFRYSYPCVVHADLSSETNASLSRVGVHGHAFLDEHSHSRWSSDDAMVES